MKRWLKYFYKKDPADQRIDMIRRFIDGDLSAENKAGVRRLVQENESWRQDYLRMRAIAQTLKDLPTLTPPDRIWQNIARQIQSAPATPVWLRWWNPDSPWLRPIRVVPVFASVFVLCVSLYLTQQSEPAYQLVALEDSSLFATEADAYIAHHALISEPSVTREGLMAYYTDGWTE